MPFSVVSLESALHMYSRSALFISHALMGTTRAHKSLTTTQVLLVRRVPAARRVRGGVLVAVSRPPLDGRSDPPIVEQRSHGDNGRWQWQRGRNRKQATAGGFKPPSFWGGLHGDCLAKQ